MTKIEPKQNCSLTNLFHFRMDPEDSIVKKVFKAVGYLLFHITTLGIPLLVHHLIVHNCCSQADGYNTISSTVPPDDATITSAVKRTKGEDKKTPKDPGTGEEPPTKPADQPVSKDPVKTPPESDPKKTPKGPGTGEGPPTKPADQPVSKDPVKIPVQTPVDKPTPGLVPPSAPLPLPSGPGATTALLNLMCQDFINQKAPLNSYPTIKNIMGDEDVNPDFIVTYPMTLNTFSKSIGLDPKLTISVGDTAEQVQLKTAALTQLAYLKEKYYVINVSGDGNCFYRAYMTGWLLHLAQTYCNDPQCFDAAADLVLSKVDFMQSSKKNSSLAQNTAKLLREIGQRDRLSIKKVMDGYILRRPSMENILVPFARALSQFESERMAFQELDEDDLKAMAMVHLQEDAGNITSALRKACQEDAPRMKGFVGALSPVSSSELHSMSAAQKMLFAASHLPLTLRHAKLVSFLQALPMEFIDSEDLTDKARQIQEAVCVKSNIPLFKKAWEEHRNAIKDGPPMPFFIEVYSFLKNYCQSVKTFQSANAGNLTAFLNLVETAITATVPSGFADGHPEASAIIHNMLMTETFWSSVLKRPEIGSGTHASIELTKTLCSRLKNLTVLSNQYYQFYSDSLLTLSPALHEDFKNFTASGSSAAYLNRVLSKELILGLFLNSRQSTHGLTRHQIVFRALWNFEMSRFNLLTPLEDYGKDAALSLSSLLYLDLPSSADLLPPGTEPDSSNCEDAGVKLSALSKVLEFLESTPEAVICHPVFKIVLEVGSQVTLGRMGASKTKTMEKKALNQIELLFPGQLAAYRNYITNILPPSLIIGEHLLIHLFLTTSSERRALVETNPDLLPFGTAFQDRFKRALEAQLTENPEFISNSRFQRFLTFLDRFGQSSRCLTGQISQHRLPNSLLVDRILASLSGRTLYTIFSSISTQAEGSNVEAMSHSFISPAICESFSSGNIAYSSRDIEKLMTTHNFMEGGGMAPEQTAPIHLFRITNHYCCLVPKYGDNDGAPSTSI